MDEEKLMKHKEDENSKYQMYLSGVVDHASKDYAEIEEILNRFRILVLANKDLVERQDTAEAENDRLSIEYSSYAKERANEILNLSNEIASLQKQLELSTLGVLRHQVRRDYDDTLLQLLA
jgi:tetraacyldisaccharide-1-P 4'-kinase